MKQIFTIVILLFIFLQGKSQSEEVSFYFGSSYYIGDLNTTHFGKNTNPALGIMYKRNDRNKRYTYRFHFMYGKVEAYDFQSRDEWNQNRNLNFKSNILELGAILEVNFNDYIAGNLKKNYRSPYLFFGIAGYKFNPKGLYNGNWYDLQALGTEGQNTSANPNPYYKLNQLAFPIGIGYKENINENWSFAIEYGARILFTDYLDDVSGKYVSPSVLADEGGVLTPILADRTLNKTGQNNVGGNRGNPARKDWYFFAGISFSYSFNKGDECTNAFREKD